MQVTAEDTIEPSLQATYTWLRKSPNTAILSREGMTRATQQVREV